MQGKTQLFPGCDSDFFRNRLTHSLEVAQIARTIAIKFNRTHPYFKKHPLDEDLVEFAGLAHDLGHPPFGHTGEDALDRCMRGMGGFEGNAQTLRILTRLEKKRFDPLALKPQYDNGQDTRMGLDLCSRSLAAILKYDNQIAIVREHRKHAEKGYYATEADVVKRVKADVLRGHALPQGKRFKTIECAIMDIADDIAYSTYDLEDALKAEFVAPLDLIFASDEVLEAVADRCRKSLNDSTIDAGQIQALLINVMAKQGLFNTKEDQFRVMDLFTLVYQRSQGLQRDGYSRTELTSSLVGEFVGSVEVDFNAECPQLSKIKLPQEVERTIEALKRFTFQVLIMSPRLRIYSRRGEEIVETIFKALNDKQRDGHDLLPADFRRLLSSTDDDLLRGRVVCDFVAGMTDRYAVEFYGRLCSESPANIFTPF